MNYDYWNITNSIEGELSNTLLIVDNIVSKKNLGVVPEFHILGGAALIFNGINYDSTLDIDIVNRIDTFIKEDMFISDLASEVAYVAYNYKSRLIPYKEGTFKSIKVYTLSNEDIVITKLSSNRAKDENQLKSTNIIDKMNLELFNNILVTEILDPIIQLRIESRLSILLNR